MKIDVKNSNIMLFQSHFRVNNAIKKKIPWSKLEKTWTKKWLYKQNFSSCFIVVFFFYNILEMVTKETSLRSCIEDLSSESTDYKYAVQVVNYWIIPNFITDVIEMFFSVMKYNGVYVIYVQRLWNNNIYAIKRLHLTLYKPIVVSSEKFWKSQPTILCVFLH